MTEMPRPEKLRFAILAADAALFTLHEGRLLVRLVKVQRPPHFPDHAGLPGGLLHPTETAEEAVVRHIEGKAHIGAKRVHLEQLYTFSAVDRDPRGRVVAVAYYGLVPWNKLSADEQTNRVDAWWIRLHAARRLTYDHDDILAMALARLRSRVAYTTLMQKLMPDEFTLTDLEQAYETVLGTDLDKRNFRKKILKLGVLTELPRRRTGGRFRPAQLFRFAGQKVKEIEVL